MKVLHLGPLWFPVSRDAAGGRETALAGLIGELEKSGCRNTLLAAGDSQTAAELVPVLPRNLIALMSDGIADEALYYGEHQRALALARAAEFDVIHSHLSPGLFSLSAVPGIGARVLHTQHTPVWRDLEWFVGKHPDLWLNTVSEFQACKLRAAGARRCSVVHNGIDVESFTFQPSGTGLVFLGRIEACKGPDLAVAIARQLGLPLTLAGPVIDKELFDQKIQPYLGDQIRYVGVVNHAQKNELLGQAGCALLPFRGDEGFGMVTIEAMACGTPVVALGNGALPEIIETGVTGYLAACSEGLAALIAPALKLARAPIRQRVKTRFDSSVMAAHYLKVYEQIVASV